MRHCMSMPAHQDAEEPSHNSADVSSVLNHSELGGRNAMKFEPKSGASGLVSVSRTRFRHSNP
jgi:hypothetical protein